jgi:hypothetical protein
VFLISAEYKDELKENVKSTRTKCTIKSFIIIDARPCFHCKMLECNYFFMHGSI